MRLRAHSLRRRLAVLSLFFALAVPTARADAGEAQNLLRNGDMTEGENKPAHWTLEGDRAKGELLRDTELGVSAPASLRLTLRENGQLAARQRLSPKLAGQRIEFSAQGRRDGGETVEVVLMAYDKQWKGVGKSWQPLARIRPGDGWQALSGEAVVPEGAVNIVVQLWMKGAPGSAWLDDAVIVRPDEPPLEEAEALPVTLSADDPRLLRSGRWHQARPGALVAEWPACAYTLRFSGGALNGVFDTDGENVSLALYIDDAEALTLPLKPGRRRYALARGLAPGEHTARIVKRTEAFTGSWRVEGFELEAGGEALEAPRPTRRIEVIGDSISAGYGNEAAGRDEKFSPATENADLAYGAVAARELGADYTCVAWSGQWMALAPNPEKEIPAMYGRALPRRRDSVWDFAAAAAPDAVVVNLGTNDFGGKVDDEDGWVGGYLAFARRLRAQYPQARLYLATGPMLAGKRLATCKRWLDRVAAEMNDANLARIDFPTQDGKAGYGADWHPSVAQARKMADQLVAALKKDLGW